MAVALTLTGCIPLVVGPNNFRPAGELGSRPFAITTSAEYSRLFTVGLSAYPVDHKALWLSEDLSGQIGLSDIFAIDLQFKWASNIPFYLPFPIGAGLGGRATLLRQERHGLSLDVALKGVAVSARNSEYSLVQGASQRQVTATALGAELHVPVSYRAAGWFALTVAPFARAYALSVAPDDGPRERAAIFGLGFSLSVELKAKAAVFAPAVAVEAFGGMSGLNGVSVAPGVAFGARW